MAELLTIINKAIGSGLVFIAPQDKYTRTVDIQRVSKIQLDATEEVSITYSNEVTSHFVNDRTDNTDNIKNNPRIISFNGVISNDVNLKRFLNLELDKISQFKSDPATLYQSSIGKAIKAKTLFTVSVPNVELIKNCAIESCSFSTNSQYKNAFRVSMRLKEIRLPSVITPIASPITRERTSGTKEISNTPTSKATIPKGTDIDKSKYDTSLGKIKS